MIEAECDWECDSVIDVEYLKAVNENLESEVVPPANIFKVISAGTVPGVKFGAKDP